MCGSAGCGRISGFFLQNGDFTLDPCEDFYEFACGSYPIYNALSPFQATKSRAPSSPPCRV